MKFWDIYTYFFNFWWYHWIPWWKLIKYNEENKKVRIWLLLLILLTIELIDFSFKNWQLYSPSKFSPRVIIFFDFSIAKAHKFISDSEKTSLCLRHWKFRPDLAKCYFTPPCKIPAQIMLKTSTTSGRLSFENFKINLICP